MDWEWKGIKGQKEDEKCLFAQNVARFWWLLEGWVPLSSQSSKTKVFFWFDTKSGRGRLTKLIGGMQRREARQQGGLSKRWGAEEVWVRGPPL